VCRRRCAHLIDAFAHLIDAFAHLIDAFAHLIDNRLSQAPVMSLLQAKAVCLSGRG
jgi:hypothetical protein